MDLLLNEEDDDDDDDDDDVVVVVVVVVVVGLLPFSLLPFLLCWNHGEGLISVWTERIPYSTAQF
jgi:hypothetical protein